MIKKQLKKDIERKKLFKKAGINRSDVFIFKNRNLMKSFAHQNNSMVALAEDEEYWVCASNRIAKILQKAGYEIINWKHL